MYGRRDFNRTNYSKFDTRRIDDLKGEEYFDRVVHICRESDILDQMEQYFNDKVGMGYCQLDVFDRVVSSHGLRVPHEVVNEFRMDDKRLVDWRAFVFKCQEELNTSYDLDEALGKFKQFIF